MGTKITALAKAKKIGMYEDAKRAIFVNVTEIDIERATCFAPDQCAMAKAACRAIPNALRAFFHAYPVNTPNMI